MPRPKKQEQPAEKYVLPPPILNATPEEIAHVTLNATPPKKWRYKEEAGKHTVRKSEPRQKRKRKQS